MLRYILYFCAVFLMADHVYTHWGPEVINWVASKFFGRNVTAVRETPYRESIIDRTFKFVKGKVDELRR